MLNPTDLTIQLGNAKYQSFLSLPVTTLRGELDGVRYTQIFARVTARQIFAGPAAYVTAAVPTFTGARNWSTQPNCQILGVNTPFDYARTRFGWSANNEDDCAASDGTTNDTAIGLGLMNAGADLRGAGYECLFDLCSSGIVDTGGSGLLWAK